MDDMIGALLRAGLMKSVGDEPERLDWLRSAADSCSTVVDDIRDLLEPFVGSPGSRT